MAEQLLIEFKDLEPAPPITSRLSAHKVGSVINIYWHNHFYLVSYHEDDDFSKRVAAVVLIQTKLAKIEDVAELFGWAKVTLKVILKKYRDKGLPGLVKLKTGPKEPKISPEIHQYILKSKRPYYNDIIRDIQELHGVKVSSATISLIKNNKMHQEQFSLFSDLFLDSLLKDDTSDAERLVSEEIVCEDVLAAQQVEHQLVTEHAGSEKSVDVPESIEKTRFVENNTTPLETESTVVSEEAVINIATADVCISQSLSNTSMESTFLPEEPVVFHDAGIAKDLSDLPAIKVPEIVSSQTSKYAGGFLLLPFLQKIDPVGLLRNAQDKFEQRKIKEEQDKQEPKQVQNVNMEQVNPTNGYNLSHWIFTIVFMLWFGFRSIENFKLAHRREFGLLLNRDHAPCVKTIRRYFKDIADPNVTEEWMMQLVRRYVSLDIVQLGTLYFDGHKIPYYGQVDLPKGYISSRRFPMKVIEQVFANDRSGRPVFLRVHDMSSTFKDNVMDMIKDALEIFKETSKKTPLVVAFDRELYDSEFLSKLDKVGVLYITWRKCDTKVCVDQLHDAVFGTMPKTNTEDQSTEEVLRYIYCRREITINKYCTEAISFLKADLFDNPDRSPSTLVTNASRFSKEDYPDFLGLSSGDIIDTLCDRWHQENYFREAKHHERLDYIPGYDPRKRQDERNLKNPEIKKLKKDISKLEKQLGQVNIKINKKLTDANEKGRSMEKVLEQKGTQKLIQEQKNLEKQIQEIKDTKNNLPKEVSAKELGYESLELVLDRKIFLDVLRIVMNNSHQMLLDIFKGCYNDPRDLHAVLYAITQQGGVVEEYTDRVVVKLKMLDNRIYQNATKKLCIELNLMQTVLHENGKFLVFDVC